MQEIPWTGWALASVLIGLSIYALVASGRLSIRSRSPRGPVDSTPAASSQSIREILERIDFVEADNKKIRREWADQQESFNRRWGSLTRQMRRDGKRDLDEAEPDADEAAALDRDQLDLLAAPKAAAQPVPNGRRLVALSRMRG
jgi:hypothetical protein